MMEDMDEWTPPTADDPISFQVWDFGGQEVYYLTHQFFLRGGRCVFLVVFSLLLGPDDNRVVSCAHLLNIFKCF
jgi:GTPase SAR1 family protein